MVFLSVIRTILATKPLLRHFGLTFYSITKWAFFAIFRGWRGSFAKFSGLLPACLDLCGLEVVVSVPSGLFAPMRQPRENLQRCAEQDELPEMKSE
jgi:hypothetical protein